MAMVAADPFGQCPDLSGVEMVDGDSDARAAQSCDEVGGLLDRLGPLVVGRDPLGAAGAPRAGDGRAGFTQGGGDSASGSSGGSRDDGHAAAQRLSVR